MHSRKNKKKDPFCAVKKKKPVVVSDILSPELSACFLAAILYLCCPLGASSTLTALSRPYIVYMLQDLDILEDWTAIRKVNGEQIVGSMLRFPCVNAPLPPPPAQAVASLGPHRVKVDGECSSAAVNIRRARPSIRRKGSIREEGLI